MREVSTPLTTRNYYSFFCWCKRKGIVNLRCVHKNVSDTFYYRHKGLFIAFRMGKVGVIGDARLNAKLKPSLKAKIFDRFISIFHYLFKSKVKRVNKHLFFCVFQYLLKCCFGDKSPWLPIKKTTYEQQSIFP